MEVRLPPEKTIEGRCVDASGGAAVGVVVRAVPVREDPADPDLVHAETRTARDGSFRLDRLGEGEYRLVFRPTDVHAFREPVVAKAGVHGLAITVPRAAKHAVGEQDHPARLHRVDRVLNGAEVPLAVRAH